MVYGDSNWAGSDARKSTTGTFDQFGQHPIGFSCSTQHVVVLSSGEAELHATGPAAAGGLQSVQFLAEAGMELRLEVLTDSTANLSMHNRIGTLLTQEAAQAGRFSLKKVGTCSNLSDLATKHHDDERLKVLITLARLRYTKKHGHALSTATESWTAAVNAVPRSQPIELDKNVLQLWGGVSSLADPGGSDRRELSDGRSAERNQDQHTSNALFERGSGSTSI